MVLGDARDEAQGAEPEDAELEGLLEDGHDLGVTVVRRELDGRLVLGVARVHLGVEVEQDLRVRGRRKGRGRVGVKVRFRGRLKF